MSEIETTSQPNIIAPGQTETRFTMSDTGKVSKKTADGRTITGLGIVFNKPSVLMMTEEGRLFYEIIHPEAVARAMQDPTIWVDYNHEHEYLLGTQYAGTARFTTTEEGVIYEADPANTTYANDLLANIEAGNIRGSSFVFVSDENKDVWTPADRTASGAIIYQRDIYNILKVISMGPVFGEAYPDTSVAKRSLENWQQRNPVANAETTPINPHPGHDPRVAALIFG